MTLLRFEINADHAVADEAAAALVDHPHTINVTRHARASLDPDGDVLSCDVPREAASDLLHRLDVIGLCRDNCNVTIGAGLSHISERADRAERDATGHASDALIWPLVRDTLEEEIDLSLTFVVFMVLAALLGAIGVVTNSAILVIGAMVLGPEFGPIASLCVSAVHRDLVRSRRACVTLIAGFLIAVLSAIAFTWVMREFGVFPDSADFSGLLKEVASPGWLSLVIALIAGTAGVLTLTSSRNGPLIGVLISVTTIPAASAAAVLFSYGRWDDGLHALLTLAINVLGITVAGIVTLVIQRVAVRRLHESG